jgi:hypothetical protein
MFDKIIILDQKLNSVHHDREEMQRKVCFDQRASEDLELIFCPDTECIDHVSLWKPLTSTGFSHFMNCFISNNLMEGHAYLGHSILFILKKKKRDLDLGVDENRASYM